MSAKKGQLVQIHSIVLKSSERAAALPEDTKSVDLEMWVKGDITADAELGQECEVITATGRKVSGTLVDVEPRYTHDFGNFVPELNDIRAQVKEIALGRDS